MRILKYLFLLVVLFVIAASVFVATQSGKYDITKSRVIKSPRTAVYNYVNDYRNWDNWISWETKGMKFSYPGVTSGKGSHLSWKDDQTEGSAYTLSAKDNDSIVQNLVLDGRPATGYWTFKDTVGGTKVSWRVKGEMGFLPKIYSTLDGGPNKVVGNMYQKSLNNLDKILDYEINTYAISTAGVVSMPIVFYLCRTIRSTAANVPKNIRILITNMTRFFRKNKIASAGKPFVIYESEPSLEVVKFSVCMPVPEEVFTAPGSEISFGRTELHYAVKVILKGDHSHLAEARKKGMDFISEKKLSRNSLFAPTEVYLISKEDTKRPSQWITELYIPVNEAVVSEPLPPVTPPRPVPLIHEATEDDVVQ